MLIADLWARLAADHGVTLSAPPSDDASTDVLLAGPAFAPTAMRLVHVPHPISPSRLRRVLANSPDVPTLVVAPAASATARDVADKLGASVLVTGDDMSGTDTLAGTLIDANGNRLTVDSPAPAPPPATSPGRVPWGHFNVAFQLLAAPAPNQRELAARAGVTQPLVAQAMRNFADHVRHDGGKWSANYSLPQWLVEHYPRNADIQTRWLTLDPVVPAARTVTQALVDAGIEHAWTGDIAADHLAPWAHPVTAHVVTSAPLDLTPLGMTPAPQGANILISVSRDRYALRRTRTVRGQRILEPWRVWVDLAQSNRTAAAQHLRHALDTGRLAS